MKNDGEPTLNFQTGNLECGGCGKKQPVKLPNALAAFGEECRKFAKDHKGCAKLYAPKS